MLKLLALRITVRWACAVLSLSVALLWLATLWKTVHLSGDVRSISLTGGCLVIESPRAAAAGLSITWPDSLHWTFERRTMRLAEFIVDPPSYLRIPLWAPFLAIAAPTVMLWCLKRGTRPAPRP